MKRRSKVFTARFEEKEIWAKLDPKTGEIIGEPKEVDVLIKEKERTGFMITYLADLVRMIDTIGNKKMKVVKYILENMDKSTNTLIQTTEEIAKRCKVSRQLVSDTLKLLDEVGFIARKTGVVMLSPRVAHKGNLQKERYLLMKFFEMQAPTHTEYFETPQDS